MLFNEIDQKIDDMQKEIIDCVIKLASFPTVNGNELEAQEYIAKTLKELLFDEIDVWEPAIEELRDHEAFISERDNFLGSPNVVGSLRGAGNGKSLIINSHIDVVTAGNEEEWHYPPFQGTLDKGNIYGRGVSDMKGTNAAVFGVLKVFNQLGIKLKGDLIFQSVIEEENGGTGTLACALKGYKADAALIPEISDYEICTAQVGSTWFRITIRGKSYHGGKRYHGVSAIEKAYFIINALEELEKYRNMLFSHPLYKNNPIPFCINIGKIQGGEFAASVPEKAVIEGRIGIVPGENMFEGRKMLEEWVGKACNNDSWLKEHKPQIEWYGEALWPNEIRQDHPLVIISKTAYEEVLEKQSQVKGAPWACDGGTLSEFADTPTLIFGPGSVAHCADEYIVIDDLISYTKILARIILNWCGYIRN